MNVVDYFQQLAITRKFTAFDYGIKKNLKIYGTKEPLNFLENYDKYDFYDITYIFLELIFLFIYVMVQKIF